MTERKIELLAPVGSKSKLMTALHFGADAVYLAGKQFGLRAFADNFTDEEISEAVAIAHSQGKKVYVTLNIFARNTDFGLLAEYAKVLEKAGADAVIVTDMGFVDFLRKNSALPIHLSTQANTTNKYAVAFWRDMGLSRVVLARELTLDDIREISDYVGDTIELEAFVHGAMCISYSGRCLLSSYLTDRDSNRGECVQACRWKYAVCEESRPGNYLPIEEDSQGTYLLNSMDLSTMPFLDKVIEAGVTSLKIEGRMKSEYYVGTVVNAYRKRLDGILKGERYDERLEDELLKVAHRDYTDGFYLGEKAKVCRSSSKARTDYTFIAEVKGYDEERGVLVVEQRNRFFDTDVLEIISVTGYQGSELAPKEIYDESGERISDCKRVQQRLYIKTDKRLEKYDILRRKL